MIYTYASARDIYGQLTNDRTASNLDTGLLHINSSIMRILGRRAWPFLFREGTANSVANQQYIEIPNNIKKVTGVKVTSGTTEWIPREVPNLEAWNRINYTVATANPSDYPDWYYPLNGRVYFHPTPSTARTVTVTGRIGFSRLNISDYSTGSIFTATLGGTAVVGTGGTVWSAPMRGRYLRIAASDTANKGDDEWYEIASVESATELTLKKPYLGVSVSTGTASYLIAQVIPLPDGYQEAPIYWATHVYYSSREVPGAREKAKVFKEMHDETVSDLESDYGSATDNVVLEDVDLDEQLNPNLVVRL